MSSSAQNKVEKNFTHCVQCNYLKESMSKFSCNHLICRECLCLLLTEKEFNYKQNTLEMTLKCPECEPTSKKPEDAPFIKLTQNTPKTLNFFVKPAMLNFVKIAKRGIKNMKILKFK